MRQIVLILLLFILPFIVKTGDFKQVTLIMDNNTTKTGFIKFPLFIDAKTLKFKNADESEVVIIDCNEIKKIEINMGNKIYTLVRTGYKIIKNKKGKIKVKLDKR